MGRRTLQDNQLFAERYEIVRVLGKGGMGTVYLAMDNIIREEVALKVMHADYSQEGKHVDRFIREVQVSRKIAHPHVVRTYDAGVHEGQLFFTMECVLGESLKDELKRAPLEPQDVASIMMQVCDGLSAIHATNVVHRDLKPANFIRSQDGNIKIADFGIARAEMSQLTGHEEVIGSTAYMAPEIWSGKDIGPPADIYALGISAYELLTGKLPFTASTPAELMWKHLEQPPPALKEELADIPGWLNDLILILLEKSAETRPCNAWEIRDFLIGYLESDSVPEEISLSHPSPTVLSTNEREIVPQEQAQNLTTPGYHTTERRLDEEFEAENDPYAAPGVQSQAINGHDYELEPFVEATGEHSTLATQEMTRDMREEIDELYGTGVRGRKVRLRRIGINLFILTVTLVLLLWPVADFLLVRWKLALAARHGWQLAGYGMVIFTYYSILLSIPAYLCATLRSYRFPKSIWWKMSLVNLGIIASFLAFSVLALDSKLKGASKLLQIVAYSSAVEPAVTKAVQMVLLQPFASVYQVVNQNGVVQVTRAVGATASALDWYFAAMFVFLFSFLSLLERRGKNIESQSRLMRAISILVFMAVVISLERFLAPFFVRPSALGIVEKHSFQIGLFFPVFDWYSVCCGCLNWALVLFVALVFPCLRKFYSQRVP